MKHKFDKLNVDIIKLLPRRVALNKIGFGLASIALVAGALCVTGFGQKHYQLGGAWVGGHPGFTWSTLQAPMDPLGQTCAARPILKYFDGQFAGLLSAFGADSLSDATGEARMISADTAKWTLIAYAQVTRISREICFRTRPSSCTPAP